MKSLLEQRAIVGKEEEECGGGLLCIKIFGVHVCNFRE